MEKSHIKFFALILASVIIVAVFYLTLFYKPFYFYRPVHRFFSTHTHRLLNANNINTIRPWMTFDYVNKVFKLPADYLKTTLNISDTRYPNISFNSYAKEKNIKNVDFIMKIQEAIHNYLSQK